MIAVKIVQDIESEGLVAGDVISVDKFSAAAMVKRGVAEEYTDEAEAAAEAEPAEYGGQPAATIDDIHDPDVKHDRRVQTVVRVGGPDPGPPRVPNAAQSPEAIPAAPADVPAPDPDPPAAETKSRSSKAAPGAEPVGGAAGGGDAGS